jgi:colanic acid/amylovoran biosynthesis glycosyltransferase
MHVAHFLPKYLPITEAWLGDAFKSLQKLRTTQSLYTLATITNKNFPVIYSGYTCYHDLPIIQKNIFRLRGLLTRQDPSSIFWFSELEKKKPDVIHVHFSHLAARVIPLAKRLGIPAVISVYGSDVFQYANKDVVPKHVYESLMQYEYIVCTSLCLKRHLEHIGIPERKIKVWYLGVDTTLFKPKKLLDSKKNIDILCNGRFVNFKGHTYLLKAIPKVLRQYPNLKVSFIGTGPMRDEILREIDELGIADHVKLLGNVPHEEIPEVIQRTKVFVQPSTNIGHREEALGMALVEACSCCTPVIGIRTGGIPEIIKHGKNGFLIPDKNPNAIADAIVALMENKDLRIKFGKESRNIAEQKFELQKQVRELAKLYLHVRKQA